MTPPSHRAARALAALAIGLAAGAALPAFAADEAPPRTERLQVTDPYLEMPLRDALAALERRMIEHALAKSGGNRAEAARILGIARPQLYAKMEEHGMARAKE